MRNPFLRVRAEIRFEVIAADCLIDCQIARHEFVVHYLTHNLMEKFILPQMFTQDGADIRPYRSIVLGDKSNDTFQLVERTLGDAYAPLVLYRHMGQVYFGIVRF